MGKYITDLIISKSEEDMFQYEGGTEPDEGAF